MQKKIEIENIRDAVEPSEGKAAHKKDISKAIPHPGLGEGGKYHIKENEHPLPDSEILTFALAGNQNCGKTTLFNQLTGSSQHVGNFPGVTVDRKDGNIRGRSNTLVTDLPGIYSMSPYSSEEIVTRNFRAGRTPKGNHQYCRCNQYRAKSLSDHAADGTGYSDGPGIEYDG